MFNAAVRPKRAGWTLGRLAARCATRYRYRLSGRVRGRRLAGFKPRARLESARRSGLPGRRIRLRREITAGRSITLPFLRVTLAELRLHPLTTSQCCFASFSVAHADFAKSSVIGAETTLLSLSGSVGGVTTTSCSTLPQCLHPTAGLFAMRIIGMVGEETH